MRLLSDNNEIEATEFPFHVKLNPALMSNTNISF